MKGDMSITTIITLTIVVLVIFVLVGSLKGAEPLADFLRNLPDFFSNKTEIKYDPSQEFTVYDEFGSLYPAIEVYYDFPMTDDNCDDDLLFRWDKQLGRVELAAWLNLYCTFDLGEKSNRWVTNPNMINHIQTGNDVSKQEKPLIVYVMGAKSEDEMLKRISDISVDEHVQIGFPYLEGNKNIFRENDKGYKADFSISPSKFREKRSGKIEVADIKDILLRLPEYYIFKVYGESDDYPNIITAYLNLDDKDFLGLEDDTKDKSNYNSGNCPSYDDLNKVDRNAYSWVQNTNFIWESGSVKYEIKDNVAYIKKDNSFYVKFLCAQKIFPIPATDRTLNSFYSWIVDRADHRKEVYPNLNEAVIVQRKLKNGENYP